MIVKTKKIKSNYLDLKNLKNLHLSIQFSLDGFSFCVYYSEIKEYILFSKYIFDDKINTPDRLLKAIKQIFLKDIDLQYVFKSVLVIHKNDLVSFVPNALLDKENLKNYIQFNNKVLPNDFFAYDNIKNHEMVSVYIPYVNVNNFFIELFGSFTYKHTASILVEKLLNNYVSKEVQVFVNVAKNQYELIIVENRKLLFYNTFSYKTKADFIYYLLFTAEQLELDVEQFLLYFLGEITKKDEIYIITYEYIRNINFLTCVENSEFINIDNKTKCENFVLLHAI